MLDTAFSVLRTPESLQTLTIRSFFQNGFLFVFVRVPTSELRMQASAF